jgi:nucleotide-binding universal stress UspA family protein
MVGLQRARREAGQAGAPPPILLASEGRPFGDAVLRRAAALAAAAGTEVRVLSVARIWGSSFGFPNPWLMPSKREWEQQRDSVAAAVAALAAAGVAARGEVAATRDAARRITRAARDLGCTAIVMAAEPRRAFPLGNLLWSQEPHRVARRA